MYLFDNDQEMKGNAVDDSFFFLSNVPVKSEKLLGRIRQAYCQ